MEKDHKADPVSKDVTPFLSRKTVRLIGVLLIVLILVGIAGYFYNRYRKPGNQVARISANPADEVKSVVGAVSRLMELPADEEPTVATVADIEKLRNQAFFTKAQNGDKVLIYNNAKKAILYRPGDNKIIDVAPVTVTQNNSTPSAAVAGEGTSSADLAPAPSDYRFVLYNGTEVNGLTRIYESELLKSLPSARVVAKENAADDGYVKSVLIGLTAGAQNDLTRISATLGLTSSDLPAGEVQPEDADYLIILGTDQAPETTSATGQ